MFEAQTYDKVLEEILSRAPDGIDLFGALERLKKSDPWKDYFRVDQELK